MSDDGDDRNDDYAMDGVSADDHTRSSPLQQRVLVLALVLSTNRQINPDPSDTTSTMKSSFDTSTCRSSSAVLLLLLLQSLQIVTVNAYGVLKPSAVPPPQCIPTKGISHEPMSRRGMLATASILTAIATTTTTTAHDAANALDFDAFMKAELDKDADKCNEALDKKCKPKLSEDEATCRFGQPSKATGEACVRAGLPISRPGGVDAFGKMDRGDYVTCKTIYVDDGKKYVKTRQCSDGRVEEL